MSNDEGTKGLEVLEEDYALKLLAYLCVEIESTVPRQHVTSRARRVLAQAELIVANACDYDRFDQVGSEILRQWAFDG